MPARRTGHLVRFGTFEFDLGSGDLWKGGRRVRLQNQPKQVLRMLVERAGELMTRDELRRQLWPDDTFVDFENGLNVAVRKIREALGDLAPSPRFIETERGQGYRFIAPLNDSHPAPVDARDNRGNSPGQTTPPSAYETPDPIEDLPRPHGGPSKIADGPPLRDVGGARGMLRHAIWMGTIILTVALTLVGAVTIRTGSPVMRDAGTRAYTQITHFTDSAVAPAISADGRMIAFIRSDSWFLSPDQIWIKLLPNGEAVQLTNMPGQKYGPAFSPDGSLVAFTVVAGPWQTYTVPVLGGDTRLMMSNAAGLTWTGPGQVLFSAIKTGLHLGIVTAAENRSNYREVYFPQHERAMAHYSYASPDRKWALVVEMNHIADWQPCRVVPLDGSSSGWQVGPRASCTSAAWTPDGRWMYFSAQTADSRHLWRQRFPKGDPEQLTFGPNEESGVAVFPDGQSLITSIGTAQSAVWIHSAGADHALTSEGDARADQGYLSVPSFSRDGRHLYYELRLGPSPPGSDLWRVDVDSGKAEPVVSGFSIAEYDVANDESEVVFSTQLPDGKSQLWLASLDRHSPPKQLSSDGEGSPHFGRTGEILFRLTEGTSNYLARMNRDGSGRRKVISYPIGTLQTISPGGDWAVAISQNPSVGPAAASVAISTAGGEPRQICPNSCAVEWAPDGRFVYVTLAPPSRSSAGKTLVIPLSPGTTLPELPPGGIRWPQHASSFPGARVIEQGDLEPSPDPEMYAYVKRSVHRNLFQIPLR